MKRKRIAIVAPRCGDNVVGGAEALALCVADDLRERHDVAILTTCAEDYWTWENVLPEGVSDLGGIPVHRFPVDAPRNLRAFDRLSRQFRYRIATLTPSEQEQWLREQGPYSTSLLHYLAESRDFDAYIFVTYLYATTYFGLPLVRDQAILIPLAHDEWPLYFPVWRSFFESVRFALFATPESREVLRRRFRGLAVTGEFIHPRIAIPEKNGSGNSKTTAPYILYLGRIDESKGVYELVELFERHLQAHPESPWNLVLAGPHAERQHDSERIHFVGAVDGAHKQALIDGCGLFAMPSYHESLCIALLEAWAAGRASLVNGWNPVLVAQSQRSNGGLWYRDQRTFDATLALLDERTRLRLGNQGKAYVERTHARGNTLEVIERAIGRLA